MNSMANVFLFQQNVLQVLLGIILMDVHQLQTLAHQELIIMVLNVFHIHHVIMEKFGMIL